jgi:mono/diheme cytochrome c family protein
MQSRRNIAGALLALIAILSAGCDASENAVETRWYTAFQVERGRSVFQTHCAACHGAEAQGLTADWKQRTAEGSFPPPPLNGTAHAWHHPLSMLVRAVNDGGIPLGGTMPGFKGTLGDEDILAAIAYFQSYWPREIYLHWQKLGGADS